jgi:PEP-CTERM motif
MRYRSVRAALTSAAIFLGLFLTAAPAFATLFVFHQTSAIPTGAKVVASISINGSLSDLPTITMECCTIEPPSSPIDFGNLLAFDLQTVGFEYTLSDFKPACFVGPDCLYGSWSISPTEIDFGDTSDDFHISLSGSPATIIYNSDALLGFCPETGPSYSCEATGTWDPVPEPATNWVFMTGLGLMGLLAWRNRRNCLLHRSI